MASIPGPQFSNEVVSGIELKLAIENLDALLAVVPYRTIVRMADTVIDILGVSTPRTPVDSGELRRSGTAEIIVGNKTYRLAAGRKGGGIRFLGGSKRITPRSVKRAMKANAQAEARVSYYRLSEDGRDVALWAHEVLLPYEARPDKPAARTPGTGPKYLESAFNERKGYWITQFNTIAEEVAVDLKAIAQPAPIAGRTLTGELWAVKPIKLVINRLKRLFRRR